MARKAAESDFTLDIEGVGIFTFARRAMRDEIAIQVQFARIIQGVDPTEWLSLVGGWIAALTVLTVKAPDDWDIEEMDPADKDTYAKLNKVHKALIEKEGSFRSGKGKASEGAGSGTGKDT